MKRSGFYSLILLLMLVQPSGAQFISEVLEYTPAPGQYVNVLPIGTPSSAQEGKTGSIIGNLKGLMTLGSFGGYVIFRFENPVENHPDNPYGIDFVIFGNPLPDVYNPASTRASWAEPGIVSVMKDENGNSLPDDTWYELAGSDYFFNSTHSNYEIRYSSPEITGSGSINWKDNNGNSGIIQHNVFNNQPYYPMADSFPHIDPGEYILTGTRVKNRIQRSSQGITVFRSRPWGYADNHLRQEYNGLPDNPYTKETEGSGGDSFDINWAVDMEGNYVDLDHINFIKIHTAISPANSPLGEVSTEISGAFDVSPDTSLTGMRLSIVANPLPDTLYENNHPLEAFIYHSGRYLKDEKINWSIISGNAEIHDNQLVAHAPGKLILEASAENYPGMAVNIETVLAPEATGNKALKSFKNNPVLYPNPANNMLFIRGIDEGSFSIYNSLGRKCRQVNSFTKDQPVMLNGLEAGVYWIVFENNPSFRTLKLIKL